MPIHQIVVEAFRQICGLVKKKIMFKIWQVNEAEYEQAIVMNIWAAKALLNQVIDLLVEGL